MHHRMRRQESTSQCQSRPRRTLSLVLLVFSAGGLSPAWRQGAGCPGPGAFAAAAGKERTARASGMHATEPEPWLRPAAGCPRTLDPAMPMQKPGEPAVATAAGGSVRQQQGSAHTRALDRLQELLTRWVQHSKQDTAAEAITPQPGREPTTAGSHPVGVQDLLLPGLPMRRTLQQVQQGQQPGQGLALPGSLLSSLADSYGLGGVGSGGQATSVSATPAATAAAPAPATQQQGIAGDASDIVLGGLDPSTFAGGTAGSTGTGGDATRSVVGHSGSSDGSSDGSSGGSSSEAGPILMFGDAAPQPTSPSSPAAGSAGQASLWGGSAGAAATPSVPAPLLVWQRQTDDHSSTGGAGEVSGPATGGTAVVLRTPSRFGPTGLPAVRAATTPAAQVALSPSITLGSTPLQASNSSSGGNGALQPTAINVPMHVLHDEQLYDADYIVPDLEDDPYGRNPLFDPLYRAGMDELQCAEAGAGRPGSGVAGPRGSGVGTLAGEGLPGLCLAPHAPMVAQLAQPLYDDDYTQDFGTAVHGTPTAVYGPAGLQLDALRVATLQAAQFEPGTWSVTPAAAGGVTPGGGLGWRVGSGNGSGAIGGGFGNGGFGGGIGNNGTGGGGGGVNPYEAALGPYVPYTDRVLFSPIASLIGVPYPVSIYAGELYIAEADPLLTAAGEAARAGLLVDYYLERNYYTPFTFTRVGPSVLALTASTARSRGQIGVAAKARALAQALYSYQRSRYLANSVEVALGSRGFAGASLGAYLFNNPLVNNQFLLQGPDLAP